MLRSVSALALSLAFAVVALAAEGDSAPRKEKPSRPLRVLLVAGSPTREYQFLRALLVHDSQEKRVELSICLQPPPGKEPRPGIVQDVPKERLHDTFPKSLDNFDVIVAFDPDWTRLTPEACAALKKWVETKGGLVLIPGPINTRQLTVKANADKLKPILDLFPVELEDSHKVEIETSKPRRLHFSGKRSGISFLKLDEKGSDALAGWEEFFTGQKTGKAKDGAEVERGFFSYYPVRGVKKRAVVVATLADPKARLKSGKEQPYLVAMPLGEGRVLYLGSGELWRLRPYSQPAYERLWRGMLAHVGANEGNANKKER